MFQGDAKNSIWEAKRYGESLALLIIDMDNFKFINDRLGHSAGDRMLKMVADALKERIRGSDIAARYRGDEFVIILKRVNPENAKKIAKELKERVEELSLGAPDCALVEAKGSMGLAFFPCTARTQTGFFLRRIEPFLCLRLRSKESCPYQRACFLEAYNLIHGSSCSGGG
ncbi:MAG: GGDEF domain-containing protein [Aquificaceae bacterium]|nr:GGDEF domain-containing protein [Aquificaceae bacterium]